MGTNLERTMKALFAQPSLFHVEVRTTTWSTGCLFDIIGCLFTNLYLHLSTESTQCLLRNYLISLNERVTACSVEMCYSNFVISKALYTSISSCNNTATLPGVHIYYMYFLYIRVVHTTCNICSRSLQGLATLTLSLCPYVQSTHRPLYQLLLYWLYYKYYTYACIVVACIISFLALFTYITRDSFVDHKEHHWQIGGSVGGWNLIIFGWRVFWNIVLQFL